MATSSNCTVVTAFIDLSDVGSKQPVEWYLSYSEKFTLKLKLPMIIFIEAKHFGFVKETRKKYGLDEMTRIILIDRSSLETFTLLKLAQDVYERHSDNLEKPLRNPYYLLTCHSKREFLSKAIKYNFFKTSHYMWLDFGIHYRGYSTLDEEHIMKIAQHPRKNVSFAIIDPDYKADDSDLLTGNKWVAAAGLITMSQDDTKFLDMWQFFLGQFLQLQLYPLDENLLYYIWKHKLVDLDIFYANYDTLALKYHGGWPKEDAKQTRLELMPPVL